MSVGTWTRFSAVPVRSLNRRPQSRQQKRRKPWTVRPSRSRVDDEWQCGQSMTALLIAQNGPANLSGGGALGKLPRDLTEPLIAVNAFLILVALSALISIWFGRTGGV